MISTQVRNILLAHYDKADAIGRRCADFLLEYRFPITATPIAQNTYMKPSQLNKVLKDQFGLYLCELPVSAKRIRYDVEVTSLLKWRNGHLPCGLDPETVTGCWHYDRCYHGETCPAARNVAARLTHPRRMAGIQFFTNRIVDGDMRF